MVRWTDDQVPWYRFNGSHNGDRVSSTMETNEDDSLFMELYIQYTLQLQSTEY